jgi:hypothetical protein
MNVSNLITSMLNQMQLNKKRIKTLSSIAQVVNVFFMANYFGESSFYNNNFLLGFTWSTAKLEIIGLLSLRTRRLKTINKWRL